MTHDDISNFVDWLGKLIGGALIGGFAVWQFIKKLFVVTKKEPATEEEVVILDPASATHPGLRSMGRRDADIAATIALLQSDIKRVEGDLNEHIAVARPLMEELIVLRTEQRNILARMDRERVEMLARMDRERVEFLGILKSDRDEIMKRFDAFEKTLHRNFNERMVSVESRVRDLER